MNEYNNRKIIIYGKSLTKKAKRLFDNEKSINQWIKVMIINDKFAVKSIILVAKNAVKMYIHERDNWTSFIWDSEKVVTQLGRVRHLQGKLLGQIQTLGFDVTDAATLSSLTHDVIETSMIEGKFLDVEEVRSSIANKMGIGNESFVNVSRDVEGIVEILLDATQHFAQPLTHERLFGWHNALFPTGYSSYTKIDVARYRSTGMKVVSGTFGREKIHFEAPSPDRIEEEMEKFLDWFNEDNTTDFLIKAAIAHLWFITIHPFDDGNGRIGRAIMDMQLARSEQTKIRFYSMSKQIYEDRKSYNKIIEQTQKGNGDITEWLLWFLNCFENALSSSRQYLSVLLDKALYWKTFQMIHVNDRQRIIINYLYDNYENNIGFLRTSTYSKMIKCSTDTALRDLQDLVKKGMMKVEDRGKKTNYILCSPNNIRIPKCDIIS
ncbi:MAG: Fic family protein [Bacteroidales bacterium]|jgi:Fic family protein|nr:Fic family protein [Bacteroidales bacterium]